MWTNNHIVYRFILLLAIIILTACGGGSKTGTPDSGNISPRVVTGIEITSTNDQPTTNDTAELKVIATFDDGTTQDITAEITLESSNTEVVTINDGALVTHEFIDEVTISATYQTEQASLTLNVNAPADATLSSFEFLPGTDLTTLTKDSEVVVAVTYDDDSIDNNKLFIISAIEPSTTGSEVTYEFSSEDAKFKAVVTDTTQTSVSAPLTVLATLSSITIQTSATSAASGSTITVSAEALYSDKTTADITNSVDWSSDNIDSLEHVADTDTFLANNIAGIANIKAIANDVVSNTLAIDVTVPAANTNTPTPSAVTLDSISITPNSQEITTFSDVTFSATGHYSDQSTQTITGDVSWSSNNTVVLDSNSNNNIFTGKAVGNATVTASLDNIETVAEITVTQPAQSAVVTLQSLNITPTSSSIQEGESQLYTLTGKYSDNPTIDVAITSSINWSITENVNNPITNNNTATFTPGTAGSYTITATTEGQSQTANLVVQAANPVIDPTVTNIQILLANDNPNLISNTQNNSVVVRLNYVNGASETVTDQITWEVQNPQLLTVIGGNIQTGNVLGQTRITAHLNTLGLQTFVNVNVIPKDGAVINAIEITESNITMLTNADTILSVKGIYDDGSETLLSQGLSWFSTDELIATVNSVGKVTSNNLNSSTTISAIYTDPVSNINFTDGVTVNVFNTGSFDYVKLDPSNAAALTRVEGISDLEVRPIVQAFENPVGLLKDIPLPSQNIGYYVTLVMPQNNERFALMLNDLSLGNYDNTNASIFYLPADDNVGYVSTSETTVSITLTQFDTAVGGHAIGSFTATLCRIGWDCTQTSSTIEVKGEFYATVENPKTYSGYENKLAPKQIDEKVLNQTQIIGTNNSYYQLATKIGTLYTVKATSSAADVSFKIYATSDFISNNLKNSIVENASDQTATFTADGMTSFIQFNHDGAGLGNTFQISVTALAPVAQGSESNPWTLSSDVMPINYNKGQVDKTASYYQTNVIQGVTYRVTIEMNSSDLSLSAATNNTAAAFNDCPYSVVDRFYRCVVFADTSNLFIKVDGTQTNTNGRDFTLKVEYHAVEEALTIPTISHQGQVSNGITMNIDTGGGNEALNSSNSIYWIQEITANTYYLVSLTEFTDALQLWVRSPFGGNTLENGGCNTAGLPNTSEIYCLVKANAAGSMSINVISFSATGGSPYKITIRPITNNVYDVVTMGHDNVDCSPCSANELAFYREGETKAFAITSQDDSAYARKLIYADPGEKIYIQVTDPQRLGINYGITVNNNGSPPNQTFGSISNPDIFEGGSGDNTISNATPLELNRVSNHSLSNNNGNFGDNDWFVFTAP